MTSWSPEKITPFALVLLITGAIDSIRNLPGTALFGSALIFFFLLSAVIFLIPVALIAAELSSAWSEEEGGIYSWVHTAFGPKIAFLAIWLQWINTMVWYPTILSFIAGTFAYLINPELVQNKCYLIGMILCIFWSLTLLGLSGIRASARFAGFSAMVGMIFPMAAIIFMAIVWLLQGKPIAIAFDAASLLPNWGETQSWVSLTAIMTSFLGMELAAVHVRNVDNPQKNFPRAMFFSVFLILFTMILGSLAIAFVLPNKEISLVGGVMQAFESFLESYQLGWALPIVIVLLLIGSLGGMVNWIISPAKGLLVASEHGFLPNWLHKRNRHDVASNILILQAVLVTLLCSVFYLLPAVNNVYWLFTALSTELYILMYVLMFFAAIKLKAHPQPRPFEVPGGKIGYYAVCLLGLLGCTMTLIIGFIPPETGMHWTNPAEYRLIFGVGMLIMIVPVFFFYGFKQRNRAIIG